MKKTIIAGLALVFVMTGCNLAGGGKNIISLEDAKKATTDFINSYLMQPGSAVTVREVSEEGGLYKAVVVLPDGNETTSYLSKDGTKFFPQVMDVAEYEVKAKEQEAQQQAAEVKSLAEIPKLEKTVAELFVMSFCPYGVQAEQVMAPVVDLLGDKADIQIRFIASVPGNDLDQVQSLHGKIEGIEGARQLCVAKNYDTDTFWNYLKAINNDCYPIYRNGEDAYEVCWKKAAVAAKVDTGKIESCLKNEGAALIKAEDESAKGYGVSGSPTLIINGARYNGARTPEGYKTAICNGFNNPPAECAEQLSTTGGAANGGC